jgi:hypothetical protein
MVDDESTTEQNRDTNQHRDQERHERSPSFVRAGEITRGGSGRFRADQGNIADFLAGSAGTNRGYGAPLKRLIARFIAAVGWHRAPALDDLVAFEDDDVGHIAEALALAVRKRGAETDAVLRARRGIEVADVTDR